MPCSLFGTYVAITQKWTVVTLLGGRPTKPRGEASRFPPPDAEPPSASIDRIAALGAVPDPMSPCAGTPRTGWRGCRERPYRKGRPFCRPLESLQRPLGTKEGEKRCSSGPEEGTGLAYRSPAGVDISARVESRARRHACGPANARRPRSLSGAIVTGRALGPLVAGPRHRNEDCQVGDGQPQAVQTSLHSVTSFTTRSVSFAIGC